MPTLRVHGIEIHFERHGEQGEPLVLMHGYTGDITDWRFQVPEFSRTHRVLVMDLDHDALVEASKHMAQAIPGAVLEVVPQAAHSPQYERPELFNAALRRHLERNAGAAAK